MRPPAPFVVGAGRSGTTLLRLMLDAHPALAIPHETAVALAVGGLPPTTDVEGFVAAMTGFPTWPDLATTEDELRQAVTEHAGADGAVSTADAVRAFFGGYAHAHGKARWGDKTPIHTHHIPALRALLPEARFVHLIRDGRAVAASVHDLWFRAGNTMGALAASWVDAVTTARRHGAGRPDYLEVRYESLVTDPEPVLRSVCEHIDLPYDPAMLTYAGSAASRLSEATDLRDVDGRLVISQAERLHNQRWTSEPPAAARIDAWRTELRPLRVRRFEAVAGDLLAELGYPLIRSRHARRGGRGGRSR